MPRLTIVIGSRNPVKINAARNAITNLLQVTDIECIGLAAPSNVPEQPMNRAQTLEGALNRIAYCQQQQEADYYVAIEGGVDEFEYGPCTFAYVAICHNNQTSVSRSSSLPLPKVVFEALKQGEELGPVMDKLFNTQNVKQKQGAIGLLTSGLATRESVYNQTLLLAMAPFINPQLYAL
jgi:inosine/xanthosine triphosphatase